MKLTFRGNSYEIPAPIQLILDSREQPKIKLTYRGNTYDYTPSPVVFEEVETDTQTVTLIYRGNTYERKLYALKSYQKPNAINRRWQRT